MTTRFHAVLTAAGIFIAGIANADPIRWESAETVRDGVKLAKFERTEPQLMKIAAMRIDLTLKGLSFTGTPRDPDWGKPMPDCTNRIIRTLRVSTAEFIRNARTPKEAGGRGLDMIVAANSAPWSPWTTPFTHKYGDPSGLNISDGIVISDHHLKAGAIFVVWKNGTIDIVSAIPEARYPEVLLAHSGFDILLKNGKEVFGKRGGDLHPRIAYGLSADRHYLYLITVDGRQPERSLGASYADLAALMRDAGAVDAINMDGGGSTTLIYWDEEEDEPVICNYPVKGGAIRRNGMNMGIYVKRD